MSPTLHLLRHAQAKHNLSEANHYMHDPLLTELGEQQCHDLKHSFPHHSKIDLVVASPLKRTIQTALIVFGDTLNATSQKVICLPELQETSALPCDTGSSKEILEQEFLGKPVDLQYVTEGWACKKGRWAGDSPAIQMRARQVRVWLRDRPEKNIVVVTHGGLLHYIIEDWADIDRFSGTSWANTEWRSVYFTSPSEQTSSSTSTVADSEHDMAHVKELPESQQRRRHQARPLDHEEQENLERTHAESKNINGNDGHRSEAPGIQSITSPSQPPRVEATV